MIDDPETVVERAQRMVQGGVVLTADGREVALKIDTICVHGDTAGSAALAAALRAALEAAGVTVTAF